MVMHSPWWIEEHWGRGFEIVSLSPDGFACEPSIGHGSVLMRKRDVHVTPELFEQVTPGDWRELPALAHGVEQLQAESVELRRESGHFNSLFRQSLEQREGLEARIADVSARLSTLEKSRSWNLTRPLRSIAHRIRVARL
jgi:hypothetical protein